LEELTEDAVEFLVDELQVDDFQPLPVFVVERRGVVEELALEVGGVFPHGLAEEVGVGVVLVFYQFAYAAHSVFVQQRLLEPLAVEFGLELQVAREALLVGQEFPELGGIDDVDVRAAFRAEVHPVVDHGLEPTVAAGLRLDFACGAGGVVVDLHLVRVDAGVLVLEQLQVPALVLGGDQLPFVAVQVLHDVLEEHCRTAHLAGGVGDYFEHAIGLALDLQVELRDALEVHLIQQCLHPHLRHDPHQVEVHGVVLGGSLVAVELVALDPVRVAVLKLALQLFVGLIVHHERNRVGGVLPGVAAEVAEAESPSHKLVLVRGLRLPKVILELPAVAPVVQRIELLVVAYIVVCTLLQAVYQSQFSLLIHLIALK